MEVSVLEHPEAGVPEWMRRGLEVHVLDLLHIEHPAQIDGQILPAYVIRIAQEVPVRVDDVLVILSRQEPGNAHTDAAIAPGMDAEPGVAYREFVIERIFEPLAVFRAAPELEEISGLDETVRLPSKPVLVVPLDDDDLLKLGQERLNEPLVFIGLVRDSGFVIAVIAGRKPEVHEVSDDHKLFDAEPLGDLEAPVMPSDGIVRRMVIARNDVIIHRELEVAVENGDV